MTVFTYHFLEYTYVQLQESITSAETVSAKREFEAKCRSYGTPILHYHCDKGHFTDNAFKNSVRENGQIVNYCGVNAHCQNSRSENKIRDLREAARKNFFTQSIDG